MGLRAQFAVYGLMVCAALAGERSRAMAAPVWPKLEQATALKSDRNGSADAAVIVAVERYETLPPVPGARLNAMAWYNYLTGSLGLRKERISALSDADAKEYMIRRALEDRAAQVQKGGRLWFVFIGHGAPSDLDTTHGQDGLLVGYEAVASVEGLKARSLRRSEVLKTLASTQGEAIAILDACFSGTDASGNQLVPGLMPLVVVGGTAPDGVLLMTAAGAGEFAGPLPGASRPAFSYLLLGALRGWGDINGDGRVTAEEAVTYTRDALVTVLRGARSQHPTVTGAAKTTTLTLGTERGPSLQADNPFAATSDSDARYGSAAQPTQSYEPAPRPSFTMPPPPVWHGKVVSLE